MQHHAAVMRYMHMMQHHAAVMRHVHVMQHDAAVMRHVHACDARLTMSYLYPDAPVAPVRARILEFEYILAYQYVIVLPYSYAYSGIPVRTGVAILLCLY